MSKILNLIYINYIFVDLFISLFELLQQHDLVNLLLLQKFFLRALLQDFHWLLCLSVQTHYHQSYYQVLSNSHYFQLSS